MRPLMPILVVAVLSAISSSARADSDPLQRALLDRIASQALPPRARLMGIGVAPDARQLHTAEYGRELEGPALGSAASTRYRYQQGPAAAIFQGAPMPVPEAVQPIIPKAHGTCAHKCCKTVMQPFLVWKCATKPCQVTVHKCKETGVTPFCDSCCDETTGTCTEVYGIKLRKDIVPTTETWELNMSYQCVEYRPQCVCCDCGKFCDCPHGDCHTSPGPHSQAGNQVPQPTVEETFAETY